MNGTSRAGRLGVPGAHGARHSSWRGTTWRAIRTSTAVGREAVAAEPRGLRRQPARDALALVAVAGPDGDRAAAAVAGRDADGGVGVRHHDDRQRQALAAS